MNNEQLQQYNSAVKRLALEKMKNDILFDGKLRAVMRRLSSLGLEVSKESMLKDIETEVNRQKMSFDIETPNISIESQSEIEQLKNNLGSIYESISTQEQRPINISGTIPREPVLQSPEIYGIPRNNLTQMSEQPIQPTITHTEQEKQEIREQLQQVQEEVNQRLEWAKQQPNEPQFTSTHSDIKDALPEWTKDNGISGYSTPSTEQVKEEFNSQIRQEQNFDEIYDLEIKKLTELKKNNNPNYEMELANAIRKISSLTDRIPNIREQLESDINYEVSIATKEQTSNQEQTQQVNQKESKEILQEQQKQMKDKIIDQIMGAMNRSGEFSFGDISMGERMSIMQNIQNKLNAKSMDELQMLLSTYQEQNVEEETMRNGMHR